MMRAVLGAGSAGEALSGLIRGAARELGFTAGFAWTVRSPSEDLECVTRWCGGDGAPDDAERIAALAAPASAHLRERVRTTGTAQWSADLAADPDPATSAIVREGLRSVAAFPLQDDGETVGVIELWSPEPGSPPPGLVDLLSSLGPHVARRLDVKRTGEDLTARKRSERLLQEQTAMLRSLAAATSDLIFVKDREGRLLFGNPAVFSVIGPEQDVLGKTDLDFHPDAHHAQAIMENDRRIMASGRAEVIEEHFASAEGVTTFLVTKSPYRDENGRIVGLVGIGRDITERKRLELALRESELRLREADQRKDEFLATLAHELRNPLAPIANAVQLLLSCGSPGGDVATCGALIERQVQHLSRLVDDLLDVARITRGQVDLRRERVELGTVLEMAVETSRPWIETSEHRLSVVAPDGPVTMHADPVRLAQVLSNLLNNAARYTPAGGRIELSAEVAGESVVIRVRDDGIGIAAEDIAGIFEMFRQGDGVERGVGGLGLGLNLVRRFVEMHGGTVSAGSAGVGKGSEFVVQLPVLLPPATGASTSEAPAGSHVAASRPRRILVVDDNVDAADSLSLLLQRQGHDVRTAYHGLEAVDVAGAFSPEIVLLDIGLPTIDGIEVARRMRALPEGHRMVIIALTGWSQDETRRRTEAAGFDHHFAKPVDFPTLTRLLDAAGEAPRR